MMESTRYSSPKYAQHPSVLSTGQTAPPVDPALRNHHAQGRSHLPVFRHLPRGTFYLWYHRCLSLGADGLTNKSSRPHKIQRWLPKEVRETIIQLRLQRHYGPDGMALYLRRKHNWFVSIHHCVKLLRAWEREYNTERPHMTLDGKTPQQYLTEKLRHHISSQALTVPVKSVQEVP